MIRFLKERLSTALRANGDGKWVRLLDGICRDYNDDFVRGTTVRRSQVNQHNYLDLLEQLFRSPEPTMRFNMAETFRSPSGLSRFLWKYKVGDRVLLARRVDYDLRGRHHFEKPSVTGSFGPTVYLVTSCTTKKNWQLFICPVYTLSRRQDGVPLSGKFYEVELAPADFSGRKASRREARLTTAAAAAAAAPPRRRPS
jgi:PAS domain-containing protein